TRCATKNDRIRVPNDNLILLIPESLVNQDQKTSCTWGYYYPDLLVTCDQRDRLNKQYKNYPCLIIEVLSESTEARDRGVKFANYQTLESLQEYVLINQAEKRVEVFRRTDRQFWLLQTLTDNDILELQSINLSIPVTAIYEGVELAPDSTSV
ncbi:MAG: Uma2 family endonuclease, partial [Snowella sp.]